jgi:organic radical activating enzyme
VGMPCYFVRFFGCNRKCSYCDTKYAVSGKFTLKTADDVVSAVAGGFPVVVTGGEPTLQRDFLIEFLRKIGKRNIFLETNGARSIKKIVDRFDFISFHLIFPFDMKKKRFIREISQRDFGVKVIVEKKTKFGAVIKVAEFLRKFKKGILILQPVSSKGKIEKDAAKKCLSFAKKIYGKFQRVFVIPQIHKALDFK